jgi:protein-L-isoaspartate O-methyltransferase
MVRVTPPGTEGYGENAVGLINTWQTLTLNDKPKAILALVPTVPSLVLDVGAGIGTDAGALAALGHRVVAVEPVK